MKFQENSLQTYIKFESLQLNEGNRSDLYRFRNRQLGTFVPAFIIHVNVLYTNTCCLFTCNQRQTLNIRPHKYQLAAVQIVLHQKKKLAFGAIQFDTICIRKINVHGLLTSVQYRPYIGQHDLAVHIHTVRYTIHVCRVYKSLTEPQLKQNTCIYAAHTDGHKTLPGNVILATEISTCTYVCMFRRTRMYGAFFFLHVEDIEYLDTDKLYSMQIY